MAGYLYAHCSTRYLKPRHQALLHLALLAASIALLPILPSPNWKPAHAGRPIRPHPAAADRHHRPALRSAFHHQSVAPSLVCAGETGRRPLSAVRALKSRIAAGSDQLSALGRTAVSPRTCKPTDGPAIYILFVVLCATLAWSALRSDRGISRRGRTAAGLAAPAWQSACSGSRWPPAAPRCCFPSPTISAPMSRPFRCFGWLTLGVYLLSFIICFERESIYHRAIFLPLLRGRSRRSSLRAVLQPGQSRPSNGPSRLSSRRCSSAAMACHGELARLKPDPASFDQFLFDGRPGRRIGRPVRGHRRASLVPHLRRAAAVAGGLRGASAWSLCGSPPAHGRAGSALPVRSDRG